MDMQPTAEQAAVIEAAKTGENLVIQAGAGTGKTSTLQMISEQRPRQSLYVAYNKAIATDAGKKFGRLVECRTSHSLAYRAVGYQFQGRIGGTRRPSWQVAKDLDLKRLWLGERGDIEVSGGQQARIALDTVLRFCYSNEEEITSHHIPHQNNIEGEDHKALCQHILPLAKDWWEDGQNPQGWLPYEMDFYLKMWALTSPELPYDVIYLDEAQDSNLLLSSLIQDQTSSQQIVVGDGAQQLYGWRGAVDALKDWPGAQTLYLNQSWRFGQAIAEEANKWLSQLPTQLHLIGNPDIDSTLDILVTPEAVLCRTNAGAMGEALMALDAGQNVALVGGGKQLAALARACADLQANGKTQHPELFAFDSWEEVDRYAREDLSGRDLLPLVNLVNNHGVERILAATQALVSEENADVVVSTVHKAKGREWPTVKVGADFFAPRAAEGEIPSISDGEAMVGYVAVTRAREVLDRDGVAWIDDLVGAGPPDEGAILDELAGGE